MLNNFKIFFQPDYSISDDNYFLKGIVHVLAETFIFPVFFSSKVNLNKGDIVLDIGASIGSTALVFSKMVRETGRVFAFEPVTFNTIYKNLQENKIKNVEIIPKGISNEIGKIEIEISDFCIDCSICKRRYTKDYYKNSVTIDVVTLDKFCTDAKLERIDFIKLDVEGAEELVIRGARKLIEKYHPKWSISSYHTDFNNEPQHDKLVRLLKEFGYRVEEEKFFHIYAW